MANLSKRNEAESPQKQSQEFWDVLKKHLAIFSEHYRQPISELSVIAYAEDLSTLTAEELNEACIKARQTTEFIPVSAKILECAQSLKSIRLQEKYCGTFHGPPLLEYPELPPEEIEERKKWREEYAKSDPVNPEPPEKPRIVHPPKPLAQQKEELRKKGWTF